MITKDGGTILTLGEADGSQSVRGSTAQIRQLLNAVRSYYILCERVGESLERLRRNITHVVNPSRNALTH